MLVDEIEASRLDSGVEADRAAQFDDGDVVVETRCRCVPIMYPSVATIGRRKPISVFEFSSNAIWFPGLAVIRTVAMLGSSASED